METPFSKSGRFFYNDKKRAVCHIDEPLFYVFAQI